MLTCKNCGRQYDRNDHHGCCSSQCFDAWMLKNANTMANIKQAVELSEQTKILREMKAKEEAKERAEQQAIKQQQYQEFQNVALAVGFKSAEEAIEWGKKAGTNDLQQAMKKKLEWDEKEQIAREAEAARNQQKVRIQTEYKEKVENEFSSNDQEIARELQYIDRKYSKDISFGSSVIFILEFILIYGCYYKFIGFPPFFGGFAKFLLSIAVFCFAIRLKVFLRAKQMFKKIIKIKSKAICKEFEIRDCWDMMEEHLLHSVYTFRVGIWFLVLSCVPKMLLILFGEIFSVIFTILCIIFGVISVFLLIYDDSDKVYYHSWIAWRYFIKHKYFQRCEETPNGYTFGILYLEKKSMNKRIKKQKSYVQQEVIEEKRKKLLEELENGDSVYPTSENCYQEDLVKIISFYYGKDFTEAGYHLKKMITNFETRVGLIRKSTKDKLLSVQCKTKEKSMKLINNYDTYSKYKRHTILEKLNKVRGKYFKHINNILRKEGNY